MAFIPDYNVQSAQVIYPGADLSEQISTAGKEASGTGNMKFALNGALTIGTLDGANVEMRDRVGAENFFLFGLTAEQVAARLATGYRPVAELEHSDELRRVVESLANGMFSGGNRELFHPLVENLTVSTATRSLCWPITLRTPNVSPQSAKHTPTLAVGRRSRF